MVHFNVPDMTCGGVLSVFVEQKLRPKPAGVEVEIDVAARQVRVPGQAEDDTVELVAPQLSVPDTKQTPWRGLHRAEQPVAAAVRLVHNLC